MKLGLRSTLLRLRDGFADKVAEAALTSPRFENALRRLAPSLNGLRVFETLQRRTIDTLVRGLPQRGRQCRRLNVAGMDMLYDLSCDQASRLHYFAGIPYEADTAEFLFSHLPVGGIFADIGANHGYFTVSAALRVGPAGRVFSFEPNPAATERLRRHAQLNEVEERVTVVDAALSDVDGQMVEFFVGASPETNVYGSLRPSTFALNQNWLDLSRRISVRTRTFDNWFAEARPGQIDVMKIDVENAESLVLAGMVRTLRVAPPRAVICETENDSESSRLLAAHGYRPRCQQSRDTRNLLLVHEQ